MHFYLCSPVLRRCVLPPGESICYCWASTPPSSPLVLQFDQSSRPLWCRSSSTKLHISIARMTTLSSLQSYRKRKTTNKQKTMPGAAFGVAYDSTEHKIMRSDAQNVQWSIENVQWQNAICAVINHLSRHENVHFLDYLRYLILWIQDWSVTDIVIGLRICLVTITE